MTDVEIRLTLVRDLMVQMPGFPASDIVERAAELARFVVDGPAHVEPRADAPRGMPFGELEAAVRALMAEGLGRGAIAKRLNHSPSSVGATMYRIRRADGAAPAREAGPGGKAMQAARAAKRAAMNGHA